MFYFKILYTAAAVNKLGFFHQVKSCSLSDRPLDVVGIILNDSRREIRVTSALIKK
jgi:hypothetical protein